MKKLLMLLLICAHSLHGAAAAKGFDLIVAGKTNRRSTLALVTYIDTKNQQDFTPLYLHESGQETIKVLKVIKVKGVVPNDLSVSDSDPLLVSDEQNEQLKSGNYYVEIVFESPKKLGVKIRPKIGQKQAQEEGKKAGAIPGGVSPETVELVTCKEQLKKAQDDLAAAQARIGQLEAQVRALKEEYQPGS